MDYETYRSKYFVDPIPQPRYDFTGHFGVTLFYQDYEAAIQYYEQIFGPPAYVEGKGTRGWQIGEGWLTLLWGRAGNPKNIEVTFMVSTPVEADALHQACIAAGGEGPTSSDELMYAPIHYCSVTDPFGVNLLIISPLE